jgi:plastocyanin
LSRTKAAGLIAACLALPRLAFGAEGSEVEELRREVRQLENQIQSLRAAISEAAELDKQRAGVLTRALKNASSVSIPEAGDYTAPARSEPAPAAARPVASAPAPTPAPRREAPSHHAVAAVDDGGGIVRGKVDLPSGEPVAYVYVDNILAPAVKGEHKTIEQSGKKFMPGWAVIQRGTTITFPNKDNIYHNVFSMSPGNSFDLGLYNSGGEPKSHTFIEAGPVDVYCNIHPQMAARVLVVPNRYFAKVKADGTFEIPNVPSGRRKIVAWSPGSSPSSDWVEVGAGRASDMHFKLEPKSAAHKNKAGQSYGSYE